MIASQKSFFKRDIIERSSADRRDYDLNKPKAVNRSTNYRNIIAHSKVKHSRTRVRTRARTRNQSKKNGKGNEYFMNVNNKYNEYVHWDDPNELVDRLRLKIITVSWK